MNSVWKYARFGNLCEHSAFGPRFSSDEYAQDGNVACLRTMDIDSNGRINYPAMPRAQLELDRFRNHVLRAGDLIVTRTGAYLGKAAVFESFPLPVLPGAFSIRFRIKQNDASPYFLRCYLNSPAGQGAIDGIRTGSAQPNINIPNLHSLTVPLPPLHVQHSIVRIVTQLESKIDLNRRTNETLESMARALFKSWFVDFDPVRAKAEGRAPVGMDEETAKLFPSEFVESELGSIPKGWTLQSVGEIAEVVGGSTPSTKTPEFWEPGVHSWVTPKDLSTLLNPAILSTERKISDLGLSQIGSGLLPVGTVLLSSRAPIGYLGIAEVPVAVNQGFIAMKPKTNMSGSFLLRWAESAHDEIISRANGSTFLEISKSNFRPIRVVVPQPTVLSVYDATASRLYRRVVNNELESRSLAKTRDALLPRLLSGELSITDAERAAEAAL